MSGARASRHARARTGEGGFTFVELLVVMIILGILAALAIAVFFGQREKAQRASAISQLRNSARQAVLFRADASEFPDAADLEAEFPAVVFVAGNVASTNPHEVSVGHPVAGDADSGIVMAAAGGGTCYYLRMGPDEIELRHHEQIGSGVTCAAQEFTTGFGSGW